VVLSLSDKGLPRTDDHRPAGYFEKEIAVIIKK